MKQILLMATTIAMGLISFQANAKTVCVVNRENPKEEMTFDQTLFSGEIASNTYIVIKRDGTVLPNFNIETDLQNRMKTPADAKNVMQEFNGAAVITIVLQSNNQLSIGTEHFDFSQKNSLPVDSFAFGDAGKPLELIDGRKHLSVYCSQQ